ncbi:hypothetical protein QYE76_020303 [Lolium multiflorum]|uniref:Uncharacterized protein n=1 Tax=Lolium multiflorum TaxID=4521 RepID=A0AAD8R648_LOLMU|nr:hypothetical protein QYE76_020303 [Lolium multiflorum]
MSRRFLYMVVGNCSFAPSSYTLHRINPSHLFYPKDSPKRAAAAVAAGAKATTMEAAESAERTRMKAMRTAEEAERARKKTMWEAEAAERARMTPMRAAEAARRARKKAIRAAMRQRAMKPTMADDAENARLPAAHMNFSSPGVVMDFGLIGQSKDKIVVVDGAPPEYARDVCDAPARAVLYDDASHSVRAQPSIRLPQCETVPVAVGDNLYFMDEEVEVVPNKSDKNLRALIRYPAGEPDHDSDWFWYFFLRPPYDAIGTGENGPERRDMLGAYAVVGESHIWASTRIRGTFSMDTASGTWSRVSLSPLPFRGRAEYAPELGLWFGFPNDEWQYESRDSGLLGAWDLNSVKPVGASVPLQASGVWKVFGAPSGSFDVRSQLVHLGDGGRFCVAKLYQTDELVPPGACSHCYNDGTSNEISFAVLTGIEVGRCDGGELRMVKHRSCKYSFGEYSFPRDVL